MEEGSIGKAVMGFIGVEALYPSIDQVEGPRILVEEIRNSNLKFESVDTHLLGVKDIDILNTNKRLDRIIEYMDKHVL